jgi:hypothetical protein
MEPLFVVIFVVFAALIIIGAIYSHQQQKARRLALSQFASRRGWSFDPSNDYSHDSRFGQFSVFTTGKSRYAYNTTRGSLQIAGADWPLQYGDYHYATESRDDKGTKTHHHYLSYVIIESPYLGAPDLFIRGEGFFDRIASVIGFDDIDFESAEFSRHFLVKSSDKRFAYDVVSPAMMEFMLSTTPPTVDFQGTRCCLYHGEQVLKPEDFAATLQWAVEFFEHWPRHVTAELAPGSSNRGHAPRPSSAP